MCPLPKADMSMDAKARLFKVYLRPWTLDASAATLEVPYITALDLPLYARSHTAKPRVRITEKSPPVPRSHAAAWNDYLSNHVVSAHAARTIQNFLAAAECEAEEADAVEVTPVQRPTEVDTTWVDTETLEKLIQGKGFKFSKRSGPAVQQILEQWQPCSSEANQRVWQRHMGIDDIAVGTAAAASVRTSKPTSQQSLTWTYGTLTAASAETWMQQLLTNSCKPTLEQITFLNAVVERLPQRSSGRANRHPAQERTLSRSVPWGTRRG